MYHSEISKHVIRENDEIHLGSKKIRGITFESIENGHQTALP